MGRTEININGLGDLERATGSFREKIRGNRLIAFYAPMGAGKTTFTPAICKCLGVTDPVCPPTFTIVNDYVTSAGQTVYHFDFYRIAKRSEAIDIGIDDYFYSGNLCLMEWPENIEELLPEETLKVHIQVNADLSRTVWWEE